MRQGRALRSKRITVVRAAAVAAAAIAVLAPATSHGAVTVGETFSSSEHCSDSITVLQTTSPGNQYVVPVDGILTSWSFLASAANSPTINFKVARSTGTPDEFAIVAESGEKTTTAGQLNTFSDISVPVQAGDLIGLFSPTGGTYCRTSATYELSFKAGDTAPGATAAFPFKAPNQLNISATIEPDADSDGFGDETEDQCPGTPGPINGCPPPPAPPEADVPAPKADGTLTIDANKGKVEKGRKVTLSGQLDVAANESCEQNRQIQIQRRLKSEDDSKFETFQTVQTDAAGNFSLRTKVKKTRFYRAIVGETDACDDETSNSQKVRAQKKQAAQEA